MSYPVRAVVVLTMLLGGTLMIGGCGEAQDIPPAVGTTPGSGPPPLTGPSATTEPSIPLTPITPAPGQKERVASWTLAGQEDGGRKLFVDVAIGGPPCDTVTGLDVTETGTTVTIVVHAGRLVTANCPPGVTGALATARLQVDLTAPLDGRTLLGSA